MKKILIEKDSYYDSVFLMLIGSEVKKVPGVREAVVAMGTEVNIELLSIKSGNVYLFYLLVVFL